MTLENIPQGQAVTVSLKELIDGTITFATLTEAFGPSSLGIIIVKDLPANFAPLRAQVLSNASYLAALPQEELETLTSAAAKYLVGWSHGKETLRPGVYDTHKGSYYLNCAFHQSPDLQGAPADHHPDLSEYTAPNIWPAPTSLPSFEPSVRELCSLIIDTAALVARACDRFAVENVSGYVPGYLEKVVRGSLTTKARLLHYFPTTTPEEEVEGAGAEAEGEGDDDWCATHLDHSCLTGLTSAMFVDEADQNLADSGTPLHELPASPDPSAGLYIKSRTGQIVKVNIPRDCLAFQTGEALQLITRGQFRAVPHFVKGARTGLDGRRIARNTLAVFTQPNLEEEVQPGVSFADFARGVVARTY
ncbi:Clavaminate synthase-like protein [Aspergillus japonicus CBS 114.51]|uniref:Clavaminate synthase-like protein n=2 Tax=Aspergillus TaxID=5052 RepID=A0A2V5HPR3_ASPV1|nr:Clavaminate synthase-like protein [Aspergillus japonicus CBS 114.51]PYI24622.1 Clavaminate synthase-like protein [Aspergillus violaceofuscus CBS 115571]RAH79573.1 Clavaminate synthase-like protein [Aspergillus japonicus CBS 114.51]